jgi:hypothetical protein
MNHPSEAIERKWLDEVQSQCTVDESGEGVRELRWGRWNALHTQTCKSGTGIFSVIKLFRRLHSVIENEFCKIATKNAD